MPQAVLLLYDPTPSPWVSKVMGLCAVQGVKLRRVDSAHLDLPLSQVIQSPAAQAPAGDPLPESILLFCHFSSSGLDRLLQGLGKAGVPRTCLKAVLTPTNAGWTLRTLYDELCREREQLP